MKQHTRWTRLLATPLAALMLVLAGCETTQLDEPTAAPVESRKPVAGTAGAAGGTPGAAAAGTPQSQVATVDLAGQGAAGAAARAAAPSQRIVYFDFDSFAIKNEFNAMLDGHARALAASRDKRMVVEGHTDERGSREYNLALGQKRAEAVVRSLALLGAGEQQLEAVSFGEERPAVPGSDEEAWSRNRRAELKDR
ncbi:MAG: peptidoglycan-associated lipoprotein Pal [Rubrivivax sp.]|jgi:peptidoglycan-associated lipoprotein|nr:peptidoglycan-associated lipoprotein Pal [Betaproteobacteria bacterium]MBP6317763.1 peptidoglycan-associated lipoprotein Pal [Rubrivivax sp.]MBK7276907.1 peptidoglycan-associated lipoprotein Pal [Betaproteobacteria bacterium]MBK7459728.1 peptidoglycan-associated lipoprotein Pal [Betaproteobacteria bacterium]MBK7515640.1 peptidoglycan-associated lipoprotein Pal [Betaproteobacteria bacterium]